MWLGVALVGEVHALPRLGRCARGAIAPGLATKASVSNAVATRASTWWRLA